MRKVSESWSKQISQDPNIYPLIKMTIAKWVISAAKKGHIKRNTRITNYGWRYRVRSRATTVYSQHNKLWILKQRRQKRLCGVLNPLLVKNIIMSYCFHSFFPLQSICNSVDPNFLAIPPLVSRRSEENFPHISIKSSIF